VVVTLRVYIVCINISTIKKRKVYKKRTLLTRDASRAPFVVVGCHVGGGSLFKVELSTVNNEEKRTYLGLEMRQRLEPSFVVVGSCGGKQEGVLFELSESCRVDNASRRPCFS
jgi:hypothetical protein